MPKPFLTAVWRQLVMLNYVIDEGVLLPYLPRGVSLDRWRGECYVSLVGFMFENTRVLGCRAPGHQSFPEVNLRFYVVREVDGEVRRGVVFIKEIVSRRLVAFLARRVYDENYVAWPMWVNVDRDQPRTSNTDAPFSFEYGWRVGGKANVIGASISGEPMRPIPGSEAEFITEHYWGYTKLRTGTTAEYRVEHLPWRVWDSKRHTCEIDVAVSYGSEFTEALAGAPTSVFVAEGSPVTVCRGTRLG